MINNMPKPKPSKNNPLAIADAIKLEAGVIQHIVRNSPPGRASSNKGRIEAPEGRTRKELYVLAHECAHIALKHENSGKPRHLREYEAEMWAHEVLWRHGVAIPRDMVQIGRNYVHHVIQQEIAKRETIINADAARYAEWHEQPAQMSLVLTATKPSIPAWNAIAIHNLKGMEMEHFNLKDRIVSWRHKEEIGPRDIPVYGHGLVLGHVSPVHVVVRTMPNGQLENEPSHLIILDVTEEGVELFDDEAGLQRRTEWLRVSLADAQRSAELDRRQS